MRFSNISRMGRQLLRSTLLVAGISLAALAIGCGEAAQEAKIDSSVPTVDPTSMGTGLEGGSTPATPAATPEAAPESGE